MVAGGTLTQHMRRHLALGRDDCRLIGTRRQLLKAGAPIRMRGLRKRGKGTPRWHIRYANNKVNLAGANGDNAMRATFAAEWSQLTVGAQAAFKASWAAPNTHVDLESDLPEYDTDAHTSSGWADSIGNKCFPCDPDHINTMLDSCCGSTAPLVGGAAHGHTHGSGIWKRWQGIVGDVQSKFYVKDKGAIPTVKISNLVTCQEAHYGLSEVFYYLVFS